mgnify:FL=1
MADYWNQNLKAYIDEVAAGGGGTVSSVLRDPVSGNWPARHVGPVTVLWIDLSSLTPSDPPGFVDETDLIFDPGAA